MTWAGFTRSRKNALRLFMEGKSNKEIAADLKITPNGAEHHVRQAMNAFNANNPVELYKALQSLELD